MILSDLEGYGFLSLTRNFSGKYGKKLIDTASKTEIDVTKTASKRIIKKTAEATGDLIRNKVADQIISIGNSKEKEKTKEIEEIYIPPEKKQQVIDDLRLFRMYQHIKMEFQKFVNFLNTKFDDKDFPRFVTKKWVEIYDQSEKNYSINSGDKRETFSSIYFKFSE